MVEFIMPSLGADMESGFLREWRVKPGDVVKRGDIIAEVETQKGIIDIEVFDEGIVGDLLIRVDEKVPVGTVMTHILSHGESDAGLSLPPSAAGAAETKAQEVPEPKREEHVIAVAPTLHRVRASPLARRIAEEKGIDLTVVQGSGPEGAITRKDVEQAIAGRVVSVPAAQTDAMRMAVAAAMEKSNREIPHYYLSTQIDMSRALRWLSETNKQRTVKDRILSVALMIKAVARALQEVPDLNAFWDGRLQLKKEIHIGFVVSLRTGGVIVPAIHHADGKSPDEIMRTLSDVIPRARALKLRSSELADSTISVTCLGEDAAETVFGIIYPPQVALVGFGGIREQPWAENGMLAVRPVVTATLSADHRATDGNTGNRFLQAVKNYLLQPELL